MYENDYILKMIKQISEFIAKILFNKKLKNYDICHSISDTALKNIFGISRELLLKLPTESMLDLVCGYNNKHEEILISLTQLLINEGDVYLEENKLRDANKFYNKALHIFSFIECERDSQLSNYIEETSNMLTKKISEINKLY